MTDNYIIKCKGHHCPRKEQCVRFTSEPNQPYQEYFSRIPFLNSGYCRFYVESELEEDPVEVFIEPTETVVKKPARMKPVAKKKRARVKG